MNRIGDSVPTAGWGHTAQIAYSSNETGRYEVFVQEFNRSGGGKRQVSTEGGTEPVWSRDGGELFYRNGDFMMAVDITTKPFFSHGKPRMLFEGRHYVGSSTAAYDVTPDSRHFVMLQASESSPPASQIHIVQNWHAGLKK